VAGLDNPNNDAREVRRLSLAVMAALYDAVEQLAARAELHDDVDVLLVLVGALDGDDVPVAGEVVHDLDLAAHVLDVLPCDELALGDGLAGVVGPRGEVRAVVGGAELPLPELAPERVVLPEARGRVAEHVGRELRRRGHPAPHAGGRGRGCSFRAPLPVPALPRVIGGGGGGGDGRVPRRVVSLRATEAGEVLGSKRDAARVAHHITPSGVGAAAPLACVPRPRAGFKGRKEKPWRGLWMELGRRVAMDDTESEARLGIFWQRIGIG
jgi:hypothetical protein